MTRRRRPQRDDLGDRLDVMCGGCGRAFFIDAVVLWAGGPQTCPRCGCDNLDQPTHKAFYQSPTLVPAIRKGSRPVAQPCSVCTHQDHEAISAMLAGGQTSNREIARRFNLTESAIRRHLRDHTDQDGDDVLTEESEPLRSIGEAREAIESQRATALAAIERLRTELTTAAGAAARTPHGMRALDDLDRQIDAQRRLVERYGAMLDGLAGEEAAERQAAEKARRVALEAEVADAEARLALLSPQLESVIDELVRLVTSAVDAGTAADRARRELRRAHDPHVYLPRSVRSVVGERLIFRLRQETGLTDLPLFSAPLGRQPLVPSPAAVDERAAAD